jgi:hypothetical protein
VDENDTRQGEKERSEVKRKQKRTKFKRGEER